MLVQSTTLLTFRYRFNRRGPSEDFYGHKTLNRLSTLKVQPDYSRMVPNGIYRQWREIDLGFKRLVFLIGSSFSMWAPSVLNPSGYISSSFLEPLPAETGNRFVSRYIPVGVVVSNLSYYARAAGTGIKLLRHRQTLIEIRLPSKKQIWLEDQNVATIGSNPNPLTKHLKLTKAGHSFLKGLRPKVRGVAMNPVDHPNGGGQGKTSGGGPSTSPWGQLAKGFKTVVKRA